MPAKSSKKGRKIGRNEKWCKAYRSRAQRERNKIVKMERHLSTHANDNACLARLEIIRARVP